jgi:hypothetical protein
MSPILMKVSKAKLISFYEEKSIDSTQDVTCINRREEAPLSIGLSKVVFFNA